MHVDLPSGLSGVVRKISFNDHHILTDKSLANAGRQTLALIRALWEETSEAGPYDLRDDGKPDFGKVLQGDIAVAVYHVAVATYGAMRDVSMKCGSCNEPVRTTIDITSEFRPKVLRATDLESFVAGNSFRIHVREEMGGLGPRMVECDAGDEGATEIGFRLLVGDDETKLTPILRKLKASSAIVESLVYRITSVGGSIEGRDRRRFISSLGLAEGEDLIRVLDSHDCGIDTEIDCPECGVGRLLIPFGILLQRAAQTNRSARVHR